jgi:hypothetical protein
VSEDNVNDVVYRWHQLMFRLDELDEIAEAGVPEEEQAAHHDERERITREIGEIEAGLGTARVARLRSAHESDRAYARQMREMEGEGDE